MEYARKKETVPIASVFFDRSPKARSKDGKYPVKIQVFSQEQKRRYVTGVNLTLEE